MYIVFVPFDSMNFCMPELHLFITTTLECSGDVVMMRVSMKNDKTGERLTLKNYKDYTILFRSSCMCRCANALTIFT